MTTMRLVSAAAVGVLWLSSAAASAQGHHDQAVPPAAATARGAASQDASDFINTMTVVGLTEVQLGTLAAERGTSPDVRHFGEMMVRDHTKAGKDLAQVAAQLGVQPPTQLDQKHTDLVARLTALQGVAFDREYINAMVQGHDDVESQLQERLAAADLGPQNERVLTQWAARTRPTVKQHLAQAREIQQRLSTQSP